MFCRPKRNAKRGPMVLNFEGPVTNMSLKLLCKHSSTQLQDILRSNNNAEN